MKKTHQTAMLARLCLVLIALVGATLLVGCGYGNEEPAPTLPPATVISATQPAVTQPTAVPPTAVAPAAAQPTASVPTPLPQPPQLPAQQTQGGYPNPGLPPGQSGAAAAQPTPVAYPTP